MSEADGRRAALVAFGGVQRFREETRQARGLIVLDQHDPGAGTPDAGNEARIALDAEPASPHPSHVPLSLALALRTDADSDATPATGWGRSHARAI